MNINLLEDTEEFFTSYLEKCQMAWWVKIVTEEPKCTYYFGPFASVNDADLSQAGYIEDLVHEGVQGIVVTIEQGQPGELTIFEDEVGDSLESPIEPAISSFVEA